MRHAYKIHAYFRNEKKAFQGTGFFVKSPTGEYYFLTNAHVVTNRGLPSYHAEIDHFKDGKHQGEAKAYILDQKLDASNQDINIEGEDGTKYLGIYQDIAVLKVDHLSDDFEIHALEFDTSDYQKQVRITGFPDGVLKKIKGTFFNNSLQAHVVGHQSFDCGSSGSPIVNQKDQVLGIHHRAAGNNPLYLKNIIIPQHDMIIQTVQDKPDDIEEPVQSVCMPTEQILSFLKASPYVKW